MPIFQKNPITMRGRLEKCWLFTFRTPEEDVAGLIPDQLTLLSRDGFAFWNIVVCEISGLRPAGIPLWMGLRYRHVGYRLYVRYQPNGVPVEGLYFVRSDCDSGLIKITGNLLTDFDFHRAKVGIEDTSVSIDSPDASALAKMDHEVPVSLSPGSPFDSIYQAKAVLKYKPFGIAPGSNGKMNVVAIARDEDAWRSKLVHVAEQDWAFFKGRNVVPEVCYEVDPIEYRWNRGRIV